MPKNKNEIDASLSKRINKISDLTGLTTEEVTATMLNIAFFIEMYVEYAKRQAGYDPYFDVNLINERQIEEINKEIYANMLSARKDTVDNVSTEHLLKLYLNRSKKSENASKLFGTSYMTKVSFLSLAQDKLKNDGEMEEAIMKDVLFPNEIDVQKIGYFKQLGMPIEDLVKYHCEKRKNDYANGVLLKGVGRRNITYPIVKAILKADQLLSKEKIVDMTDLEVKKYNAKDKGNKIYACTHIGGNDIQRALQVMNVPAYLMLGDPGILYKKAIYQALRFNGVIPLETKDRKDRKIAYNRSIELLENDGNLLIYPEGAWNVLPNVLVMEMFNGTVRMARETGKPIVPIGMEQIGNTFYIKVGKEYTIDKDCPLSEEELTNELREKMATLKWEILESVYKDNLVKRSSLPLDGTKEFQDGIVAKCNYGYGFSLDDALSERFHNKNITDIDTVYRFLDNMTEEEINNFLKAIYGNPKQKSKRI